MLTHFRDLSKSPDGEAVSCIHVLDDGKVTRLTELGFGGVAAKDKYFVLDGVDGGFC